MSNVGPYGSVVGGSPNIQLAHTVGGEPVGGVLIQNADPNNPNIRPAWGVSSTTPFKGRDASLCKANGDTCNGKRAKDRDYCAGHLRSFGMLENDKNKAKVPKEPT